MNPQMLMALLWVPFVFVLAFSALFFSISGYKRGLLHALASLAVTLVSAAVSIALAGVLAKTLGAKLYSLLAANMQEADQPLVQTLVEGLLRTGLAMVIFCVALFLLVLIGKILLNVLGKKLRRSEKGMRLGGLAVRLADAVLYTLLLLLPLYGTIAAYLPTVDNVLAMTAPEEENGQGGTDQLHQMVRCAVEHPLSRLNKLAPLQAVYSQLSRVEVQEETVNIVEMVSSFEGVTRRIQGLMQSSQDGQVDPEQVEELIHYLRQSAVKQPWAYSMYRELYAQLLAESEEEGPEIQQILALMDMDPEGFVTNCDAILGLLEFSLKEDILIQAMDDPNPDWAGILDSGFDRELGKTMNVSDASIGLRQLLVKGAIDTLCEDSGGAAGLIAAYRSQRWASQEEQCQDAQAMVQILLMGLENREDLAVLEGLLRLPGMDTEAVKAWYDEQPLLGLLQEEYSMILVRWETEDENMLETLPLVRYWGGEEAVKQRVWQLLEERASQPLNSGSLNRDLTALFEIGTFSNGALSRTAFDPQLLGWVLEELGMDYFAYLEDNQYIANARQAYEDFVAVQQTLAAAQSASQPLTGEGVGLLVDMLRIWQMDWRGNEEVAHAIMETAITNMINGPEGAMQLAQALIREQGSDPFGAGSLHSQEDKQWVRQTVAKIVEQSVGSDVFYLSPEELDGMLEGSGWYIEGDSGQWSTSDMDGMLENTDGMVVRIETTTGISTGGGWSVVNTPQQREQRAQILLEFLGCQE